eukprot:4844864-Alexandrium_andersonii.AAC.1
MAGRQLEPNEYKDFEWWGLCLVIGSSVRGGAPGLPSLLTKSLESESRRSTVAVRNSADV